MSGPLSVPLPAELRRRLARYAKQHHLKLATTARQLIDEQLTELERREKLSRDEDWQKAEVFKTLERLDRDGRRYVSSQSVHQVVQDAIARVRKRRANGHRPA
jgi:hypothetical protein